MNIFKKNNIKISIIVPAYNTEKYTGKCLTSLINQTLKDIEIIIINDGSTDNTGNIIAAFAKDDSRIKVINQQNLKQSAARNRGMEEAKGEYIGFVDSDDWVDTDYFEKLYNCAKKYNSDIALAQYIRIGRGLTKKRIKINEEKFVSHLQDKFDICDLAKNPCPTNKIYRRDFLLKYDIKWPLGHYFEDKIFVTKCVYYANGISTTPHVNYYYYRNPNSTVNNKHKRHQKQLNEDKNYSKREVLNFLKSHSAKIRDKEFWAIKKDYKIFGKSIYRINESINTEKHLLFSYIPIYQKLQKRIPKNLIVGTGFSGATLAFLIAYKTDEKVVIIDKRDHIAGNSFDYRDKNGINIHKYGSHIFHTNNKKVWDFIKQFSDFNTYQHKVIGKIDGIETNIPFNFNTLYDVLPINQARKLEEKLISKFGLNSRISVQQLLKQNDKDLKILSKYIWEKIYLHYTEKQWGIPADEVDKSIIERVPVILNRDNRYFEDKYQGIPKEGYTNIIQKMLKNKNITVKLNTDIKDVDISEFDKIFYTGSIDEYFDYELGKLPYRSLNFKFETHKRKYFQSNACINYPNNFDFTRIHEYKYYLNDVSDKTVIAKEYPQNFEIGENERFYPVINKKNIALYNKYLEKAKSIKNFYLLGRLGDYKYYNMDEAILRAIELFEDVCL